MKFQTPIQLTNHAKKRMERLEGLTEQEILKDLKRHLYSMKKERGGNTYLIVSHIARYILDENLVVITIMAHKKNEKAKYRDVYMGQQWIQLDKRTIKDIILDIQAKNDPDHWRNFVAK